MLLMVFDSEYVSVSVRVYVLESGKPFETASDCLCEFVSGSEDAWVSG